MISNTDLFYRKARQYQDKRKSIMDEYEKRLVSLEKAKGSDYFTEESKKAADRKDEALAALRNEYNEHFRISLNAMISANKSRKITPPTEEELRILQLLKMKDTPTETELQAAANTLKGNATCLSVLSDIARKAGHLRNYNSYFENKEMTVDGADEIIKGIAQSLRDFMDYDTPRAARIAEERHERFYGKSPNAPALPKRRLFDSKVECFEEIGGLSEDALKAFENAVDR